MRNRNDHDQWLSDEKINSIHVSPLFGGTIGTQRCLSKDRISVQSPTTESLPQSALHGDLPPMLTLRAFEAVARHLSFVNAARELSVTQSALSHQVHKLEAFLECRLFIRRTRAIELTDAGRTYQRQVRQALEGIAAATRMVRHTAPAPSVLRIGLLASFATMWLAPRLSSFISANPDIRVELVPSYELADVAGGEVALAIRYGKGGWPNVNAVRLMNERLFPVCSPQYKASWLAAQQGVKQPGLAPGPLLTAQATIPFEWLDWARQVHIDISKLSSLMLHDYNIVVEAAVAGQGIAMGRDRLIKRRLLDGSLVQLLNDAVYEGEIGYWLVTSDEPLGSAAQRFADWLIAVSREDD
jgi:LysR family glycine cleavage system transcriptional activator